MHTFRKKGDAYEVGVWVPDYYEIADHGGGGAVGTVARFVVTLRVKFLRSAIRMTNLLNGGTGNTDPIMDRASILDEEVDGNGKAEDVEGTAKRAALVRRARKGSAARAAV